MQDDPLADGIAILGVVLDQIMVECADVIVAKDRPGDLAGRLFEADGGQTRRAGDRGLVARSVGWGMPVAVTLIIFCGLAHGFCSISE
jgi:hypothetical protein